MNLVKQILIFIIVIAMQFSGNALANEFDKNDKAHQNGNHYGNGLDNNGQNNHATSQGMGLNNYGQNNYAQNKNGLLHSDRDYGKYTNKYIELIENGAIDLQNGSVVDSSTSELGYSTITVFPTEENGLTEPTEVFQIENTESIQNLPVSQSLKDELANLDVYDNNPPGVSTEGRVLYVNAQLFEDMEYEKKIANEHPELIDTDINAVSPAGYYSLYCRNSVVRKKQRINLNINKQPFNRLYKNGNSFVGSLYFNAELSMDIAGYAKIAYKRTKLFCIPYVFWVEESYITGDYGIENVSFSGSGDFSLLPGTKSMQLFNTSTSPYTIRYDLSTEKYKAFEIYTNYKLKKESEKKTFPILNYDIFTPFGPLLPIHNYQELVFDVTLDELNASWTGDYTFSTSTYVSMEMKCIYKVCTNNVLDTNTVENGDGNAQGSFEFEIEASLGIYFQNVTALIHPGLYQIYMGVGPTYTLNLWSYTGNTCGDSNGDGINEFLNTQTISQYTGSSLMYGDRFGFVPLKLKEYVEITDTTDLLEKYGVDLNLTYEDEYVSITITPQDIENAIAIWNLTHPVAFKWIKQRNHKKALTRNLSKFNLFGDASIFDPIITGPKTVKLNDETYFTISPRPCLNQNFDVDFNINWGDGSQPDSISTSAEYSAIKHTWNSEDTYNITVTSNPNNYDGTFYGFKTVSVQENVDLGWATSSMFTPPTTITNRDGYDRGVKFIDLNGDGRQDVIYYLNVIGGGYSRGAYINTINGWQEAPEYLPPYPISETGKYSSSIHETGVKFIDLNNDGLLDMIYHRANGAKGAYINNQYGWSYSAEYVPPYPTDDFGFAIVDINGDKKSDLAYKRQTLNGYGSYSAVYINNGSNWNKNSDYTLPYPLTTEESMSDGANYFIETGVRFIDLNHDGLNDIIYRRGSTKGAYLNTGAGWTQANQFAPPYPIINESGLDTSLRLVDINADGYKDIVYHIGGGPKGAYLNTGDGWFSKPELAPPAAILESSGKDGGIYFLDLNGDGLIDMVQGRIRASGAVTLSAYLNYGNSWSYSKNFAPPKALRYHDNNFFTNKDIDLGVRFVDLNGDGLLDIVYSRLNSSGAYINITNY